jgi:hypothetical protein
MRQSVSGSVDPVSGASSGAANNSTRPGGQRARPLNGATVFGNGNLQNNQAPTPAANPVVNPTPAPIERNASEITRTVVGNKG